MFLCPLAYHVCKTKLEEVPGSYAYQIITEVSNITPCRAWRLAVIQEYTYSNTPDTRNTFVPDFDYNQFSL